MSPLSPLHAKVKCIHVFAFSLHFCSLHFAFEFIWHFNERIMSAWQPWQPWQSESQVDDTYNSRHMRLLHVRCPTASHLLPSPASQLRTLFQLSNWVTHFGSCRCTWIFWAAVVLVHVRHKNLNYLSAHTHTHKYTYTGRARDRQSAVPEVLECINDRRPDAI